MDTHTHTPDNEVTGDGADPDLQETVSNEC